MWIRTQLGQLLNADRIERIAYKGTQVFAGFGMHWDGEFGAEDTETIAGDLSEAAAVKLLDAIERALINTLPVFDVREELRP